MVRVIKQPSGRVNGLELSYYKPGRTYELTPALADYLVMEGYAVIEMRRERRSFRARRTDRRQPH